MIDSEKIREIENTIMLTKITLKSLRYQDHETDQGYLSDECMQLIAHLEFLLKEIEREA